MNGKGVAGHENAGGVEIWGDHVKVPGPGSGQSWDRPMGEDCIQRSRSSGIDFWALEGAREHWLDFQMTWKPEAERAARFEVRNDCC